MGVRIYHVLCCVIVPFVIVCAQKEEGDLCALQDGTKGKCRHVENCPPALAAIRNGVIPAHCGFAGLMPIVCCEYKAASAPAPEQITPVQTPERRQYKGKQKCQEFSKNNFVTALSVVLPQNNVNVSVCPNSAVPLIVKGWSAFANWYRHAAVLGYREETQWYCLGSLISDRFVLTSASCARSSGSVKRVRLGDQNAPATHAIIGVSEVVLHPNYTRKSPANDVALLKLASAVVFNKYILPACLPLPEDGGSFKKATVQYGTVDFGRDQLMDYYVQDTGTNDSDCDRENYICTTQETKFLCTNCIGALLEEFTKDVHCMQTITGLSNNRFRKQTGIAIYTKVVKYIDWIEDIVWS